MFKVGDRVVVVNNLHEGPDNLTGKRGKVTKLGSGEWDFQIHIEGYGHLGFMKGELEFEETYDTMSAPHPDEDSLFSQEVDTRHEDAVSHPSHYTSHPSGVECIEITKHYNFTIGSAMKYLWRAGLKGENTEIQDLRKAIQFIEFEIERLGGQVE